MYLNDGLFSFFIESSKGVVMSRSYLKGAYPSLDRSTPCQGWICADWAYGLHHGLRRRGPASGRFPVCQTNPATTNLGQARLGSASSRVPGKHPILVLGVQCTAMIEASYAMLKMSTDRGYLVKDFPQDQAHVSPRNLLVTVRPN